VHNTRSLPGAVNGGVVRAGLFARDRRVHIGHVAGLRVRLWPVPERIWHDPDLPFHLEAEPARMTILIAAVIGAAAQIAADTMVYRRIETAPAESLAVGSIGSGPTIVLVPGMLGSAFSFRAVIGPLAAEGYRVVVIDPLGTGFSTSPEKADYSLAAQSVRIAIAAEASGVDRAVFLCHGIAGAICYRMAHAHPDLVAGIISLNGGPAEEQATSGLRFALKLAGVIKFFAGDGWARGKVKDGLIKGSADPAWVTPEIVNAYTSYYRDGMGGALGTLKRMASSKEPEPLGPMLPAIGSPIRVLIGGGTDNGLPSPEELDRLSAVPRLTVDTVANAGIFIQEEQPDDVIDAVLAMARSQLGDPLVAVPALRTSTIRLPGVVRE
jgi:pimeloyl-ACP methyl ester carboxylesterase